ncbi:MAG: C-terminal binding protein [Chloroflexota bacterium]|nr:C-terminal binding protein [Chloroflexota bacterium]
MAQTEQEQPTVVVLTSESNFGAYGEREILERAGCTIVVAQAKTEDDAIAAARDADGLIYTGGISRRFMESLTRCKVIARSAIGMDNVHGVDVATERGIVLCNCPDVFIDEVANQTMALLLGCVRQIVPSALWVREGNWGRQGAARPGDRIHRVTGETLGLIGFGNIGRAVAQRAAGFGLRIIANDPYLSGEVFARYNVRQASLAQVVQDADFISLHTPLTEETRHLIGAAEFALMKPDAILVNTSRGPVVDEEALIAALQQGQILGAGLDVTEAEPVDPANPLLTMPNVIVTPHIASLSEWANGERRRRTAYEVAAVLTGHRPRAVWNPPVLERLTLR